MLSCVNKIQESLQMATYGASSDPLTANYPRTPLSLSAFQSLAFRSCYPCSPFLSDFYIRHCLFTFNFLASTELCPWAESLLCL